MARSTVWRRWYEPYTDGGTPSPEHATKCCVLSAGETITRVRFGWQAQHVAQFPSEAVGVSLVVGLVVVPGLNPSLEDVPYPVSSPTADWFFLEDANFYPYNVAYTEGVINELDVAPGDGRQRDAKAMRRVSVDSSVWLTADVGTGYESQGTFYFSSSGSCLVTEV